MNSSKKMLTITLIFLIFCFIISSVSSAGDPFKSEIRYLDEEEQPSDNNAGLINCTDDRKHKCAYDNMECENKTAGINCKCNDDKYYPNFDDTIDADYCEIEKKKQLTAFLLELFVGFGAGHFYRHHYLMASLKLVAFFIGIYLICIFPLTAKCVTDCCDNDCVVIVVSIIFYIYALGLAFWYIWDLVYFGKNNYPDCSHGDNCIDLKGW